MERTIIIDIDQLTLGLNIEDSEFNIEQSRLVEALNKSYTLLYYNKNKAIAKSTIIAWFSLYLNSSTVPDENQILLENDFVREVSKADIVFSNDINVMRLSKYTLMLQLVNN
jgi:hypothetical protein